MSPELKKLLADFNAGVIAARAALKTDDERKAFDADVTRTLQTEAHDVVWQPAVNVGVGIGKNQAGVDKTAWETEKTALTSRAEKAETDLAEARKKNPDIERITREANERVTAAEQKARDAETKAGETTRKVLVDSAVTAFEAKLIAKGVKPRLAKAEAVLFRDRVVPDLTTGKVNVMQTAGGALPVVTTEGVDVLDVVAEATFKTIDADDILSDVADGAGLRSGGGGSSAKGKSLADQIRADVKEKYKGEAGQNKPLAEAFGQSRGR